MIKSDIGIKVSNFYRKLRSLDDDHMIPIDRTDLNFIAEQMDSDLEEARHQIEQLLKTLYTIWEGSKDAGRWLDINGDETDQDAPDAEWNSYTEEEQNDWIDTVVNNAASAIYAVTGKPPEDFESHEEND